MNSPQTGAERWLHTAEEEVFCGTCGAPGSQHGPTCSRPEKVYTHARGQWDDDGPISPQARAAIRAARGTVISADQGDRNQRQSSIPQWEEDELRDEIVRLRAERDLVGGAFEDLCDEIGCEYDNEAALTAVADLRDALARLIANPHDEAARNAGRKLLERVNSAQALVAALAPPPRSEKRET